MAGVAASVQAGEPGGADQECKERIVLNGCLSLLRCFGHSSEPVVVAESDSDSLTPASRWCSRLQRIASPRTNPEQAADDLITIGRRFSHPPLLAFDNDVMLLLVSRHRDALSRYYRLLIPDAELVEDTVSKLRFIALSQRLNLPMPPSLVVQPDMSAQFIAQCVGLPCILKPDSHVGRFRSMIVRQEHGRPYKVLPADTVEQLAGRLAQMRQLCDAYIAQKCIPGDDDCIYSFHTCFDRDSRPLGYYVGRKVRTYPKGSGFSTCLRLTYEPEVVRLGLDILGKMRFVGPMKLDFKRDPATGRFYLLECNARFTLWSYLGAACGINLPRMALDYLDGKTVPTATEYCTDVRWLSFSQDLRAFVRDYRPAGDWSWPGYLWSLLGHKVHEVFSWRDPKPWGICATRYIGGKFANIRRRLTRHAPQAAAPATGKG